MSEFFDRLIEPESLLRMNKLCYALLIGGLLLMLALSMPDWFVVVFAAPGAIHFIIAWMTYGFKRGEAMSAEWFLR